MKKIIFIFSICFTCSTLSAQGIDTKHILLNLSFNWEKKQATGNAEISFTTLNESNQIVLNAGFLTIHKIILDNAELRYQYKGDDLAKKLSIQLDRFYKPTEFVKIKIEYTTNHENKADPNAIGGSFGKGLRFFQPTSTTPLKRKQIWSSGEPESNKYWFPCNEDIADIHTTEIVATVENPLMVISNGKLLEVNTNSNKTQTFHYKSETAFPNYLVFIVVGEYVNVSQHSGKTQINNYGYPDEKEAVKATVELLPAMLHFLESKIGYAYPFETYSQVVVQDYPFPGLVGQNTATLLSDNYIDDYGVHKDFKYLWDGVAVQALANQWFGNLIMPKSWNDIWLNNAFAQYFAGLFTAKDNGSDEYLLWYYPFEKAAVKSDWESGNKHPIVPNMITDLPGFTQDGYSKYKGALVLRMLQSEMGDDNWWKSIRFFVKTNAHKQVTTKDFQKAIEKITGKSYQWFFDQWIFKMGFPKLEVSKSFDSTNNKLTIKQIQEKSENLEFPQTEFFEGSIRIEIDNKIETVFLKPQPENTFIFQLNEKPSFVNFNYEQGFLCETNFSKSKEEYLAQLQASKDVLAKQDALNNLVAIALDSTTNNEFKNKIRNSFIKEISSKQYWRYRMLALGALSQIASPQYDPELILLLKGLIQNEKSWVKSTAISILGKSADTSYADIYIAALQDESDRVINAAAIALGKSKSPKAFDALLKLEDQPSWKNQNRISALNGLQQLGDTRAVEYALDCIKDNRSPRWYLATPVWDYPFAAVNTLVALGKGELAYPILIERFKKSLYDNDINDIFQNVQLIDLLKDKRATEVYTLLKEKFKDDPKMLESIQLYEVNYLESIK